MAAESTEGEPLAQGQKPVHLPRPQSRSLLHLPPELTLCVSRTDDTLVRLNQLLTTTAGLEYVLSTLNYACYLLTFLHAHSPSRAKLALFLSRILLRSSSPSSSTATTTSKAHRPDGPSLPPSTFTHLSTLLTNTRTTLRLTALVPLYTWLRTLFSSPKPPADPYLHGIALAQCLCYILFQALENVAHLIDLQILPTFLTISRYNPLRNPVPSTARLWLVSSRFWLAGVSFDILRLLREAYIEARRRRRRSAKVATESEWAKHVPSAAEAEETDRRWWSELFVAGCWWPIVAHYSVEGGLFRPSIEDGVVGALGLAASWEEWRVAWAETKG